MLNNTFSITLLTRVILTHLSRELLTDCSSLFTIAGRGCMFIIPADTEIHKARNRLPKCVSTSRED